MYVISNHCYNRLKNASGSQVNDKMSDILNGFKIFSQISLDLKKNIKYFHVFKRGRNVLFVTIDDRVYGCGHNIYGMLGFGHENEVETECEINELTNQRIIQFHIGVDFAIALSSNNKIFTWGCDEFGQLRRSHANKRINKPSSIEMLENVKIKQFDSSYSSFAILTENRKVYVWSENIYEFKHNNNYSENKPFKKIFPD